MPVCTSLSKSQHTERQRWSKDELLSYLPVGPAEEGAEVNVWWDPATGELVIDTTTFEQEGELK